MKTRITTSRKLALASIGLVLSAHGAFQAAPSVTHFGASEVSAAFAKGMPLVETSGYKIHASRREAPGMAEVHVRDTDIIYVLDGTATVVTGGDVIDGKALPAVPTKFAAPPCAAARRSGLPKATYSSCRTAFRISSPTCSRRSSITS